MRSLLTGCVLVVGLVVFALFVQRHYPIADWLFFRYAAYVLSSALLGCACLAAGFRAVTLLGGVALRFSERLLLSFSCGVLIFGIGVFVAGLARLYGAAFFFAWPAALIALAGRRSLVRLARGTRRLVRVRPRSTQAEQPWFAHLRLAFLAFGLLSVYSQVITPDNVSFDARWYHLALAEQYVAQGAIEPFRDGWYLGAYPQLATWLYTWAFQYPGSLFDRVVLSSHLEWALFLATAAGVGLLVRRIIPGPRLRWTAAALFLFPSLLIYDSNLNTGADHAVAFWAIPIALALAAARRALSWRSAVLVGAMISGAALTKYQAIYLIVPGLLVALLIVIRARRFALIVPAVIAMLVITAPHWLKNIAFYGDPVYPLLNAHLPTHPFHSGAAEAMDGAYFPGRFMLKGGVLERLGQTLPVLLTFSFQPHNWGGHDIPMPTFGSLFTLFTFTLPLLGRLPRLWLLLAATYSGVFIWFWTNHQDRFLQALLPWMAVCLAALIARVWTLGAVARFAAALLIAFQIVWGADALFYSNHRAAGDAPIAKLAELLGAGFRKRYEARYDRFGEMPKVAALLPRDAVPLLHDHLARLGLSRRALNDEYGYQGALSYRELPTARDVWSAWRKLGVTHVIWERPNVRRWTAESLARQVGFFEAAQRATRNVKREGRFSIAELTPQPPSATRRVLRVESCGEGWPLGNFEIMPHRKKVSALRALPNSTPEEVTVLVVVDKCKRKGDTGAMSKAGLKRLGTFEGLSVWVRPEH